MAIQIVFVKWGTRYPATWVNRHVRAVKEHASCRVEFCCISDDSDSSQFDQDVRLVSFPEFRAPFDYLKQGCRLKMAMFKRGILQERIPALFLDLDSSFLGDVARVAQHISRYRGIHMLKSHWLPWWPIQRYVSPLGISPYYHANGSAIGFFPEDYHWLFERFNEEVIGQPMETLPKTLRVDDRFTSYHCRRTLRVFPSRLITKYSDEYMSPSLRWERLRDSLPWVKRRRKNLVAISFPGLDLKPDDMVKLPVGTVIKHKRVQGEWRAGTIRDYWLPQNDAA